MAGTTALAIGGLALAAVGTGVQFVAGQRQAKAQKDAAEQQERARAAQERRSRRRVLRERRVRRAELLNTAAQTGASGGSGEAGGLSSLESQTGFELGFLQGQGAISDRMAGANRRFARAGTLGSIGGGISSVGGALFSNAGTVSGIFNRTPTQSTNRLGGGFTGGGQGRIPIGF